ncbi:serine/threonine protein kinase [Dechloromonas denitrificans]|uniref:serine/threonine protein kinase n=1 Tax=Dechloromonas denitrificans TaxID=281362 RepID=UPI001CF86818|nr:serine/threonine protein kinase [Dechloromonas denitrificans]UCV05391.1 HDOD domain-containing protein [Dechloromonas denitrificans]
MSKKIGRFEVLRELGRGAQSTVYLGFDPQLQREIAIKTMHFNRPDPTQNRVLLDEARTVSKLRHPSIVPIYEAGEEGCDLYLVFEYVPGKNLGEFLHDSGALSPVKALGIMRPILEAVSHAHAQGIIHRDLKPSNILLDENGTPRVMDFGIAARVDAPGDNAGEFTGTPAYMAPEYIERRESSERSDVFAAGLVLFEMLAGRRAIEGSNIFQVMHRIANENLRLSGDAAVDERLSSILYKALARDPSLRYQTAAQFGEALDNYLAPEEDATLGDGKQSTLDFLLRRIRHKSDFPALSESVSAINKIANSETESINKLSNSILKDFALTNKLLRLVNSAYFRPAGGGSISTVSRAVIVLGFEAVRNIAITVLLFEHLQNKANANQLKEDFLRANLAGILAKDISATAQMRDLEQTFICALFHSLGRLLSQFYFPEESDEIRRIMEQKKCSEDSAALQVLGISFEDMGIAIARQWGFPSLIVGSMRKLPAGAVKKAVTQEDRLRMLSALSNELCDVIAEATPEARDRELKKTMARFSAAVSLDRNQIQQTLQRSIEEVAEFARIIHLNLQQTTFGKQMRQFSRGGEGGSVAVDENSETNFLEGTLLRENDPLSGAGGDSGEAGGQVDAQSVLTAGIQDISNTLVDGFKLNDILRIILETMYRAMGFRRVVLCIRDAKSGTMQGRFGFGPEANEVAKAFRFPLSFTPDIFHAATSKGVDILISDIDDPKIAGRIPEWFRKAVPAHSFVLFPLNIKGNPVALIYADRDEPGGIEIPEKELSLLRTLRNQAVLAIKQGS